MVKLMVRGKRTKDDLIGTIRAKGVKEKKKEKKEAKNAKNAAEKAFEEMRKEMIEARTRALMASYATMPFFQE